MVSFRLVIGGLASVAILSTLGIITLSFFGKEAPQAVSLLGTGALGSLASMLANITGSKS